MPSVVNSVCELLIPPKEQNTMECLGVAHINGLYLVQIPFYAFTLTDKVYNQQNTSGFTEFSLALEDSVAYLKEYSWNSISWKMFVDFSAAYICIKINSRGVLAKSGNSYVKTPNPLMTHFQYIKHNLRKAASIFRSYKCSLKSMYSGAYFPSNMPDIIVSLVPISCDSFLRCNNESDSIDRMFTILVFILFICYCSFIYSSSFKFRHTRKYIIYFNRIADLC